VWEFGKAPELALEIVSNREGDELGRKRYLYARIEVLY
jgi:Uma2 family endonuclease